MSSRQRFDLALDRLKGSDWARFEELASSFLASEFPPLRTVASPSGDGGRDAELFSPEGDSKVLFQYSVTQSWNTKITETAKTVKKKFPNVLLLSYVTNQIIGAKADDLKQNLRNSHNLIIDIRDRSWFLDRVNKNDQCEIAAERLAEEFVDVLLKDKKIIDNSSHVLTNTESRAAYLYLTFQVEDEIKERSLTKLTFESIVRSVLRETDSEHRLSRDEIKERVRKILPSYPSDRVDLLTDSALKRMTKKNIRHWKQQDEFCLTHEETVRLSEDLAKYDNNRRELLTCIRSSMHRVAAENSKHIEPIEGEIEALVEIIIQKYLNSRGEKFASAISTERLPGLAIEDLKDIILKELSISSIKPIKELDIFSLVIDTVADLFTSPNSTVSNYLRSVADSYTLMAFLRETPDVQSCIRKLFSFGDIWLDTSIILPLLAETLIDDTGKRQYTKMLHAAVRAGLKLKIIRGIVEEVNGHINRSLSCSRMHSHAWMGDIPFLYSLYVQSGRATNQFETWVETFIGSNNPEADLIDYIKEFHSIEVDSLEKEAESNELEIRGAVQEIWRESHEYRRKRKGYPIEDAVIGKLVSHDVENYLGIIEKRKMTGGESSPLGSSAWWLTLDSTAYKLEDLLRRRVSCQSPTSPVMSLDFFANYLTFGPLRQLSGDSEFTLPVFVDRNFSSYIPIELIEVANKVREDSKDLPEHVIQRRVRDALDLAKRKAGQHVSGGIGMIKENIEKVFEDLPLEDQL